MPTHARVLWRRRWVCEAGAGSGAGAGLEAGVVGVEDAVAFRQTLRGQVWVAQHVVGVPREVREGHPGAGLEQGG